MLASSRLNAISLFLKAVAEPQLLTAAEVVVVKQAERALAHYRGNRSLGAIAALNWAFGDRSETAKVAMRYPWIGIVHGWVEAAVKEGAVELEKVEDLVSYRFLAEQEKVSTIPASLFAD